MILEFHKVTILRLKIQNGWYVQKYNNVDLKVKCLGDVGGSNEYNQFQEENYLIVNVFFNINWYGHL